MPAQKGILTDAQIHLVSAYVFSLGGQDDLALILGILVVMTVGKFLLMTLVGRMWGLPPFKAVRTAIVLSVGGEFGIAILTILIQRGKGGGLVGAFGGAGGSSAFGSKAGDAFTKITLGMAALWVLLIMVHVNFAKADLRRNTSAPESETFVK